MTDAGTNNGSVSSHEDDFVPKSKILFTCLVCLIYFLGHGKMQQIVFANEMFMQNIQTQFGTRPFHQNSIILQLPSQSKTRSSILRSYANCSVWLNEIFNFWVAIKVMDYNRSNNLWLKFNSAFFLGCISHFSLWTS